MVADWGPGPALSTAQWVLLVLPWPAKETVRPDCLFLVQPLLRTGLERLPWLAVFLCEPSRTGPGWSPHPHRGGAAGDEEEARGGRPGAHFTRVSSVSRVRLWNQQQVPACADSQSQCVCVWCVGYP